MEGETLASVGLRYGITRQRVHQIYKQQTNELVGRLESLKYPCPICGYLGTRNYLKSKRHTHTTAHAAAVKLNMIERQHRRLMEQSVQDGECLIWTGVRLPTGYGLISVNGKKTYVHRFAWELAHGPAPDGWWVSHRCGRQACVAVAHLRLMRPSEVLRGQRKTINLPVA